MVSSKYNPLVTFVFLYAKTSKGRTNNAIISENLIFKSPIGITGSSNAPDSSTNVVALIEFLYRGRIHLL